MTDARRLALRCRLGMHRVDDRCVCVRCGTEAHRVRAEIEWVEESGIDAAVGPWWNYDEAGYEVTSCDRCGKRLGRSDQPVEFRGRP